MTVESVLAHGLKTSVFGSQWHIEHAENLALLDPDRITSGLLAGRPAAGVARRFYFATDNQKLYYDTGAAWIEQAGGAAHAPSHASGGADALMLAQSQVVNLAADLAGKAAAAHTHAEGDITNLTADLAGKAAAAHTHAESDVTNLVTDLAAKAANSAVVHNTGNESIGGVKAFTDMTKFSRGAQVASAAALNLSNEDGIYFNITGTAAITSISTRGATGTGAAKGILPLAMLRFDGALTISHNAASLILPGGANITTHAGLVLTFVEESAGNWRCIDTNARFPDSVYAACINQTYTPVAANTWESTLSAISITAKFTGPYRVECNAIIYPNAAVTDEVFMRMFPTTGSPSALQSNIGLARDANASATYACRYFYTDFTLVAGTSYVFTLQLRNGTGGGSGHNIQILHSGEYISNMSIRRIG